MALPEILRLSFPDLGALEREIATNIRYGRLFISDVLDAPVLSEGTLVLVHPVHGGELRLLAQIVMVNGDGPMRGTGLALRSFGPEEAERVLAFVHERAAAPDAAKPLSLVPEPQVPGTVPPVSPENDWSDLQTTGAVLRDDDDDWSDVNRAVAETDADSSAQPEDDSADEAGDSMLWQPSAAGDAAAGDSLEDALLGASAGLDTHGDGSEAGTGDEPALDDGSAEFDEDPSLDAAPAATDLQSSSRQERLRSLNAVEQLKVARRGELSDRVVIERLYGKQVWEALLQNPRLTLPEVARIARKGTVPRPLIEQIVGNAAWTKAPNVRRALLSNPKLTPEGVMKLLALTPKHELKILEKATAYPMSVREAARKLLRES